MVAACPTDGRNGSDLMKVPEIPGNEKDRLQALRSYTILDTPSEPSFDALTKLAATILGVPIALVSLIDVDRQWFKSRYGLDVAETPREVSFCGHVVSAEVALVVEDAFADPRFADNPLVTGEPRVRFYAGIPLRSGDGFVLGTLCAIDHVAKTPTPKELEMLELLARQVTDQLEARRERLQLAKERATALENERRLKVLFDAMAEGVVVRNGAGDITTTNASAERILGLNLDQMLCKSPPHPLWNSVHEDGSPFLANTYPGLKALRTGDPSRNIIMGIHKPSGELTWISLNALPLQNDDEGLPHAVITTLHDITVIKAAQAASERLSRQEYLVTTGTLAAGVGHEINNPLAFILANLEFAIEEVRAIAGGSPSGRMRELDGVLREALEGAERVHKIVRGLRALAREESAPVATDIASVVDISLNMAAHEIRHKATVVNQIVDLPPVLADESRLTQVLVNLLVNAAQAFSTRDIASNRISLTAGVEESGRISISVADNGPGIPSELQRRIFDPFFTTKPVGEGTGLGLSICQSIVLALGGEIVVDSGVGRGTTFTVFLQPAAHPISDERLKIKVEPSSRGRVLVVDDEPYIVKTITRALEQDHDVISFNDAREALRVIEGGEKFDVVFCDLMMPHLGGDALYEQVRAIDPALADRFVFITGGVAANTQIQGFLAEVANERVDKPFSLQNLRGIARRFVNARVE